ncbi:MAG: potassium channel family protein [Chlamydiae bacterium]|nr:potassium channel family protein [Chlamydiota bacterium]
MKVLLYLKQLITQDFNQLLLFLLLLIIFHPYDTGLQYLTLWHLFFSGVLLTAIFNCSHTNRIKIIGLIIGIPTFFIIWTSLFVPSEQIFLLSQIATFIFLIFSIFSLLHRVILGKITADLIRGTVCVYLMIGFAFSILYSLLEFAKTGAFHLEHPHTPFFATSIYPSELLYFSFVTLLAMGYGDITPTENIGQTMAVLEGLIGQFYLAVIVAKIVTIYSRKKNI